MILHAEFVLAIESGNIFEVSDQVGRSNNQMPADDMNKLATDLSSSQALAQPNLTLESGCPNKLDSAPLRMQPAAATRPSMGLWRDSSRIPSDNFRIC